MNNTIVIYFDGVNHLDAPLDDPGYYEAYRAFTAYCEARNTSVFIARGDSYLGNMQFRGGWRFVGNDLVAVNEQIDADIIYLKALAVPFVAGPTDLILNDPHFDQDAGDKWQMYENLGEYMPITYLITGDNWQEVASHIVTDKIVLKPRRGSGGNGIVIADMATFDFPSLKLDVPYVAQNFIDSSKGIPGICDGYHDLRIMLFNGEPKLSFVRIPRPGSLLSNVSQGASVIVVPVETIPQRILDMSKAVDSHYAKYTPRLYTTDFFVEDGRPYLVETNTQPGFPLLSAEGGAYSQLFYEYLFSLLTDAIKNHTATIT